MTIKQLRDYLYNFNNDLEIESITKLSCGEKVFIEFKKEFKEGDDHEK